MFQFPYYNFADSYLQIGKMALASVIVTLCVLPIISAFRYDGCYRNLPEGVKFLYEDTELSIADCAKRCAANGYIYAITHVRYCYCSQLVPSDNLTSPLDLNNAG